MTATEVTVGDMPLASATAVSAQERALRARVSTRARASIAATHSDGNRVIGSLVRGVTVVRRDLRRCYLVSARPVSARAWLRMHRQVIERVPEDNGLLRRVAVVDNWTAGLALLIASVALYQTAGGVRWVACHPVRRWAFLLIAGSFVAWVVLG